MLFPSSSSVCSLALIKQKNRRREGSWAGKQQSKTQIPRPASPLWSVGRGRVVSSCELIVPSSESCCLFLQNTSLYGYQTTVIKLLLVQIEKNLIRPIGSWVMSSQPPDLGMAAWPRCALVVCKISPTGTHLLNWWYLWLACSHCNCFCWKSLLSYAAMQ